MKPLRLPLLPLLLLLLLAGCRSESPAPAAAPRQYEVPKEFASVGLDNGLLGLTFLPDSMGRLNSIRVLPDGPELLPPYQAQILAGNPLFEPLTDNSQGIRELLWKVKMTGASIPMKLERPDSRTLVFRSDFYGNTTFGLRREVALYPDGLIIDFTVELVNHGRAPAETAIWLNLIGAPPARPILPVKGGVQPIRGRGGIKVLEHDGIYHGSDSGESFAAPARNWAATALADERPAVWAVEIAPDALTPDGFFYCWRGQTALGELRTFEPVFGSRRLQPDESARFTYRLLVFPGLAGLAGIAGERGIEMRRDGDALTLRFAAAAAAKAANFQVTAGGRAAGTVAVPAQSPGDLAEFTLPLPEETAPDAAIRLESDGLTIDLLQ